MSSTGTTTFSCSRFVLGGCTTVTCRDPPRKPATSATGRTVADSPIRWAGPRAAPGSAPAIRSALARAGLKLSDIDRVEVNEAFAPQYLAVEKELGLDRAKTNVNGGAIALGHPLGASGARITAHLCYELARANGRYAVGSACIGGGQGLAVILERP